MSESNLDFKRLFEALPDNYLIILPDERYTIVAVSSAYARVAKRSRESLIGRALFETFPDNPNDAEATGERNLAASLERVIRTRKPDTMAVQKYSVQRPSEEGGGFEERWWSPVNIPLLDDDGRVAAIIHRVEEVTEFVRLEHAGVEHAKLTGELRERAEKMEREIIARGQELQAANERLRELDELKSQFFAAMSHELRTPLALILGPAERLSHTPGVTSDVRRGLEVITRNARTLLRHVTDLLDIAKIEAGRMRAEYAVENASELVRLVAGQFEVLAEERRVAFVVEAPRSCVAELDSAKFRRVILNLLANAFKFTPPRGRVRVSLKQERDRLVVEVGDSGEGIPEDKREEVFERFRQLEADATRRFGGTGLGLAIAREMVLLHGGSIVIGTATEGGALLRVELPMRAPRGVEVHAARALASENEEDAVAVLRESHRREEKHFEADDTRELILVVEDNPEMNRFVSEALEERYRVASAFDGAEGLRLALSLRPSLVLADVMMPRVSGEELVREIRRRPELADLPIVVLTAKADDALRIRLLREGAQDFITKPFLLEELATRVDNLIAWRRAEARTRRMSEQLQAVSRAHIAVTSALGRSPEQSLNAVLTTIANRARELTNAEYAAVGVGSDPERPYDPWTVVGIDPDVADSIGKSPRARSALAKIVGEDKTVRMRDVREHPAFVRFPDGHPTIESLLATAIKHQGRTIGHVFLGNKAGAEEFSVADEEIIEMLAARAGSAIDAARFYEAASSERAWLQNVIDQMPEALLLVDASGEIVLENRGFAALSSDMRGRDPYGNRLRLDLRTPDGEPLAGDARGYVRALRGESVEREEVLLRRRDGELAPVAVSAAPIRDREGAIVGATMIVQDLSIQRELERLREEWASLVAHDLRQPLSVINASAQLLPRLHRGAVTADERKLLQRISSAATSLQRMVDDLLDSSRIEANRMHIEPRAISLPPLIREVVDRTPEVAARCEVHVDPGAAARVEADPQRIEQVVANLVSNAAKYAEPASPIRVDVTAHDGEVEVTVTNRGEGIDPDELPRLFTRYRRTRATKRTGVAGLGLGLYICKGLVEAHHGRIWAESTPGATTSFHFTLPRARAA